MRKISLKKITDSGGSQCMSRPEGKYNPEIKICLKTSHWIMAKKLQGDFSHDPHSVTTFDSWNVDELANQTFKCLLFNLSLFFHNGPY